MSEKEKMLSGEQYTPQDAELFYERTHAKILCKKFNNLAVTDTETQKKILKKLFSKTGTLFQIEPNFFCDYGYNIEIGENFFANHNLVILDSAKVSIGNDVYIGPNCGIYTPCHPTDPTERISGVEWARPITIKDNVWLGGNVSILCGVTIGKNSIIGAGSVVTKEIPENVIAVGNPCKPIKNLS